MGLDSGDVVERDDVIAFGHRGFHRSSSLRVDGEYRARMRLTTDHTREYLVGEGVGMAPFGPWGLPRPWAQPLRSIVDPSWTRIAASTCSAFRVYRG